MDRLNCELIYKLIITDITYCFYNLDYFENTQRSQRLRALVKKND